MTAEYVITGAGFVMPCGDGIEAARASWTAQTPCFAELPPPFAPGHGAVCTPSTTGIIPPIQNRRLDRPSRFAWIAAHQAFQSANLEVTEHNSPRIGIAIGTMSGGDEATEGFLRPYLEKGPSAASPLLFPNCVAVAISGHLSIAFKLRGPATTQFAREASFFAALDQAMRWLGSGMAEAMLVVGTDGLFPLLPELLRKSRLSTRGACPRIGSRQGMLPGEGAQAFIVERSDRAHERHAPILGYIRGLANCAPATPSSYDRSHALAEAAAAITPAIPDAWIGGASGHRILDDIEAPLHPWNHRWPSPRHPKTLWGEFCGSGGQLMAAALVDPAPKVLITAPQSFGGQYAAVVETAD